MSWYAVHTRSRHEDRACLGLLQKSFHAFLPKMEVWSKRKDRRKKIMIPMFPGYLFVELPTLDNEIKVDVLKTFGVVRILESPEARTRSRSPTTRSTPSGGSSIRGWR